MRAMLKRYCLSTMGEERVDGLTFSTDVEQIREWHRQAGEFNRLIEEQDFPDQGY